MTDLLDHAVASLRELPPEAQDDIARALLQWFGEMQAPVPLAAELEAGFAEALAQSDRRDFATDAEVATIWAKHGL